MNDSTDSPEQRRADRLKAEADHLTQSAEQQDERASGMYGRFAGGQPLLVGHRSYRSARRDRDKADNATRRAIEARRDAERAGQKARQAQAVADLAATERARGRDWCRADFQPGDIVEVRDFRRDMALTSVYRVKRANLKTLTLDGGGGGMDDPKRTYDRVLSRTRDGVTVADPVQADAPGGGKLSGPELDQLRQRLMTARRIRLGRRGDLGPLVKALYVLAAWLEQASITNYAICLTPHTVHVVASELHRFAWKPRTAALLWMPQAVRPEGSTAATAEALYKQITDALGDSSGSTAGQVLACAHRLAAEAAPGPAALLRTAPTHQP